MLISNLLIELIKKFESFRAKIYLCPAGYRTIGYGHVLTKNENYDNLTKDEAEYIMICDLIKIYRFLGNNIYIQLSSNQFSSIASFTYNVGCAAFQRSSLRSKINNHSSDLEIKYEFRRWNKANGRILVGLVKRREAEIGLFFNNN